MGANSRLGAYWNKYGTITCKKNYAPSLSFFACRTFRKFSERSENGYSSFNIDLSARVSTPPLIKFHYCTIKHNEWAESPNN